MARIPLFDGAAVVAHHCVDLEGSALHLSRNGHRHAGLACIVCCAVVGGTAACCLLSEDDLPINRITATQITSATSTPAAPKQ